LFERKDEYDPWSVGLKVFSCFELVEPITWLEDGFRRLVSRFSRDIIKMNSEDNEVGLRDSSTKGAP